MCPDSVQACVSFYNNWCLTLLSDGLITVGRNTAAALTYVNSLKITLLYSQINPINHLNYNVGI